VHDSENVHDNLVLEIIAGTDTEIDQRFEIQEVSKEQRWAVPMVRLHVRKTDQIIHPSPNYVDRWMILRCKETRFV
jgi:hypothetical protein